MLPESNAQEFARLKMLEDEYNCLMEILHVLADEDPAGNFIVFTIDVRHVQPNMTWVDCVRSSVRDALKSKRGVLS